MKYGNWYCHFVGHSKLKQIDYDALSNFKSFIDSLASIVCPTVADVSPDNGVRRITTRVQHKFQE